MARNRDKNKLYLIYEHSWSHQHTSHLVTPKTCDPLTRMMQGIGSRMNLILLISIVGHIITLVTWSPIYLKY